MYCPLTKVIASFGLMAAALAFAPLIEAADVQSGWDLMVSDPNLPPLEGQYVSSSGWQAGFGMGIFVKDVTLSGFTQSFPPPPPGGSGTCSFGLTMTGWFSADGGASFQSFSAPGLSTFQISSGIDSGNTRNFSTEMTQLDVSGGSLPGGVLVRESPTFTSTGETSITDIGDGTYGIDSFFDVWPDLSIDGGMTWIPSAGPAAHMGLIPEPSSLALLGLGASMVLAFKARRNRK
jgi:hypothetical protein